MEGCKNIDLSVLTSEEARLYNSLDERMQRLYLGNQALQLGRSGCRIVSAKFGVDIRRVRQGKRELNDQSYMVTTHIRRKGGGRRKKLITNPEFLDIFDEIVETDNAGLPQDENVKWTRLSRQEIREAFEDRGIDISVYIVSQILKVKGYKKRSLRKTKTLREAKNRNEQFEKIAETRSYAESKGWPMLSIDTKKKEPVGKFYRSGSCYSIDGIDVYDHDFPSFFNGQLVPHGIYDIRKNTGYVSIGLSHDTSEFVCDNILNYWEKYFRLLYPSADTIVIFCDGGGSNSSSHRIVKQDFIKLAIKLKKNILMVHYPPYCSKFNPIEHRLFSQITRVWSGVTFPNAEYAKELASQTRTKTGLAVFAEVNKKEYHIQRDIDSDFNELIDKHVIFDDKLPKWNYLIKWTV